jgi:hypothetical protein
MKHVSALCGQEVEFLNDKTGGKQRNKITLQKYKACPSESGTEFGAPIFPAVELCEFSGRWQCMSGEIWYTLDSGSVLLTEAEAR